MRQKGTQTASHTPDREAPTCIVFIPTAVSGQPAWGATAACFRFVPAVLQSTLPAVKPSQCLNAHARRIVTASSLVLFCFSLTGGSSRYLRGRCSRGRDDTRWTEGRQTASVRHRSQHLLEHKGGGVEGRTHGGSPRGPAGVLRRLPSHNEAFSSGMPGPCRRELDGAL